MTRKIPGLCGLALCALAVPAAAQTTLTYSSWVPPTHHLTTWQASWAAEVEKATAGRVKFQSLPKAPAAPNESAGEAGCRPIAVERHRVPTGSGRGQAAPAGVLVIAPGSVS